MTNEEIRAEIKDLGYSDCIEDSEIDGAIRWVLRLIKYEYPVMAFGLFNLVACQQVYDLFNRVPFAETSQGVFPEGLRAFELIWSNSGLSISDDAVFGVAPFLQGSNLSSGIFGNFGNHSFNNPGDWVIWDANWAAVMHRFQPGTFEHVNDLDGSPIRVYPVPDSDCQAFIRFTRYRTEREIRDEDESWFLTLVESRCCRTLANKFSLSAGISFTEAIRDDGATAKYWEREAARKYAEGWTIFEAHRNEPFAPVSRGNGP